MTNCHQFKLVAKDGKLRLTDVVDPETFLRLIQSVPSPKAEPIKLRLAKVSHERIKDMSDPTCSLDRAREYGQFRGRSIDAAGRILRLIRSESGAGLVLMAGR